MAKVNGEINNISSQTGARQEAVQDANLEAEILKVKANLQAGQIMNDEAAKQIAKIKENLERQHASSREPVDNKRDLADISQTRVWSGSGRVDPENPDSSWTLEIEAEIWNTFLDWKPVSGSPFSTQLQDLSDIYLSLLEAVLKYTIGEAQTIQMERLDSVLSEKLNLLIDSNLKELVTLLSESGQSDTLAGIQASVYKQTTGQPISNKEAREFFNRARFTMTPPSGSFSGAQRSYGSGRSTGFSGSLTASSSKNASSSGSASFSQTSAARSSSMKDGTIYRASGGGKVHASREYVAQRKIWEGQISQRKAVIRNAAKENSQGSSVWGSKNSYTGRELARANRFVSHIDGSGDLFRHSGITAQNDEVLGLLAAVTSIKGQMYAAEAGQKNPITFPLQSAITRMIDHYLRQKAASKVYYHTIHVYEKTRNAGKAIESGLEYAYKEFKEKQADPAFKTRPEYSENAGFFLAFVKDQNPGKEFPFGLRVLEENWKEFLRAIGKGNDPSSLLKLQKLSPWGTLMEPAKHKTGKREDIEKFLLAAVVVFVAAVLLYLVLRP